MLIHQQFHGYKRGHQLLAGSLELSQDDQELIERLSDLSGSLRAKTKIYPYITCYPLQNNSYYALAKTWSDESALRSGCVITHTLLIPFDDWVNAQEPSAFRTLFKKISTSDPIDAFKKPLRVYGNNLINKSYSKFDVTVNEQLKEFVYKFFGEGIKPIVWYGVNCPDFIFWGLIKFLWPSARRTFSCCTLALQPRKVNNKYFDLMFSPHEYYPQFNKIPADNSIGYFSADLSNASFDNKFSWATDAASKIISGDSIFCLKRSKQILSHLNDEPISIRKAYLLIDLEKRISKSPTATIGILDIIDTIDPEKKNLISLRFHYINEAVKFANAIIDPRESLRFYCLLCERMDGLPLDDNDSETISCIKKQIGHLASKELKIAMESYLDLEKLEHANSHYIFFSGLLEGILDASCSNPESLLTLEKYPDFATRIICADTMVAVNYLKHIQTLSTNNIKEEHLSEWLAGIKIENPLKELRCRLLPMIQYEYESHILEELVKGVGSYEELVEILDVTFSTTNGFSNEKLLSVLVEAFCSKFQSELHEWACMTPLWSEGAAKLIAHSFPVNIIGFQGLFNFKISSKTRFAEIIAAFIRIATFELFPFWLRKFIKSNPQCVAILLEANTQLSFTLSDVILSIFSEVRDMPLARFFFLRNLLEEYRDTPLYKILIDTFFQSSITEYLDGKISFGEYTSWMSYCNQSIVEIDLLYDNIERMMVRNKLYDSQSFTRYWTLIANAPPPFYKCSKRIIRIINVLSINNKRHWSKDVVSCWIDVISKSKRYSDSEAFYYICGTALKVSFEGKDESLSELLIASFYHVYNLILNYKQYPQPVVDLFSFFDWDKAKELRRRLVEKYFYSGWPMYHLILAASDKSLIRKIFKRIYRTKGKASIYKILNSFDVNNNSDSTGLILYFQSLANDPEYYEPWD